MNLQPFRPNAITEKSRVQFQRIFRMLFLVIFQSATQMIILTILIESRWFVHVIFTQIHSVSLRMKHVQLDLFDPWAMPITLVLPFDEKFTFSSDRRWCLFLGASGLGAIVTRIFLWIVLFPTPCEDFFNLAGERVTSTSWTCPWTVWDLFQGGFDAP